MKKGTVRCCYAWKDKAVLKEMPRLTRPLLRILEETITGRGVSGKAFLATGMAQDLYLLFSTQGKALAGRQKAADYNTEGYAGDEFLKRYRIVLKRYAALLNLTKQPFFDILCSMGPTEAVAYVIGSFIETIRVKLPASIVDPFLDPQADALALMLMVLGKKIGKAKQEHSLRRIVFDCEDDGSARHGEGNDAPFIAAGSRMKAEDALKALSDAAKGVTVADLLLEGIARVLLETEEPGGSFEKTPSEYVAKDQKLVSIADVSQLSKAYPSEMADPERLEAKLLKGDVQVRQDLERKRKKQFTYIILDVSNSMENSIVVSLSKKDLAKCYILAFLERSRGGAWFQVFAGAPGPLHKFGKEDFGKLASMVESARFVGNSTNISSALRTAFEEIGREPGVKPEILLITDGCGKLDETEALASIMRLGVKMHTIFLCKSAEESEYLSTKALKRLSSNFLELRNSLDMDKLKGFFNRELESQGAER